MVKQRGKTWQADLTIRGQRIRKSFDTRADAEEYERSLMLRVSEGMSVSDAAPPPPMTMERLAEMTAEKYWVGKPNEVNSVRNADQVVTLIGPGVHPRDVTASTVDSVVAALRKSGNSPATINRKIAALSKMLTFAASRGIVTRRPTLERETEPRGRLRWFTDAEEDAVLSVLSDDPDLRDLIVFLADTGCRVGEALGLEWRDVTDLAVRFQDTKNGEPRSVPITTRVRSTLAARKALQTSPTVWGGLDYPSVRHRWEKARKKAGLGTDAVLHCWRHTCASRLIQRGVPLVVAQQWLGHKTIQMTMKYSHLSPAHLSDAVRALEGRAV
jgi:integrase